MTYNKRGFYVFVAIVLLAGIGLACMSPPSPPHPTPIPPAPLHGLPTWAEVECPEQEFLRATIVLWEHTEWPPRDDSSTIGNPGARTGEVQSCEAVEVLDYEWSSFDKEFWVLVDNHQGQRGWLSADNIAFEP